MEITNVGSKVTIQGNIKSVGDHQKIKNLLDSVSQDSTSITIDLKDSISITSSVIGYLIKLIHKDNINISMKVGDIRLYDLLDDLNLISTFNAKKTLSS